jgi:hypothetical protein
MGICFGSSGAPDVCQIWYLRELLKAFGARLVAILAAFGMNPARTWLSWAA